MRCRILMVFAIFIPLVRTPSVVASESIVSYGPMRPETVALLRSAFAEATTGRDEIQRENLEALRRLAKVSWPHVTKLPRVRVIMKDPESFRKDPAGWLLADDGTTVSWFTLGFKRESNMKVHVRTLEKTDFQTDVNSFLRRLAERAKAENKWHWDYEYLQDQHLPLLLFRLAYLAADHGLQKETTLLIARLFQENARVLPAFRDEFTWRGLDDAMTALHLGNDRHGFFESAVICDNDGRIRFLKTCKELRAAYPGSKYDRELQSLIESLDREAMVPVPPFLKKKPSEFTEVQAIRYWIYQLRDLSANQTSEPGYPSIFASFRDPTTPADQVVAIGPAAIPFLIEALEDSTPTRTLVHSRFQLDSWTLLRRQDIAFRCLESIVGCRFYHEDSNLTFASDTPERRSSALAHAKACWAISKNVSQAQMVRNYLSLMDKNISLRGESCFYDDARLLALRTLGMLEGPEAVMNDLQQIKEERFFHEPTLQEELLDNRSQLSEQETARRVAAIENTDLKLRRQTIAKQGHVSSYKVQRALLHSLEKETEAAQRLQIILALETFPKLWHLAALTQVLERDNDLGCRLAAGRIIRALLNDKSRSYWWIRLETREVALRAARRLVQDRQTPLGVRQVACDILLAWDSFVDAPLLTRLRQDPDFRFQEVKLHFDDLLKKVEKNEDIVPTLAKTLSDQDDARRERAAKALGVIGPEAAGAVPQLIVALKDQRYWVRQEAATSLGKVGPKARPALPALLRMFKSGVLDFQCRRDAGEALLLLDPEGKVVVPALIDVLRAKEEREGWLVVNRLGFPAKILQENADEKRWLAAELLGSFGAAGQTAVTLLQESLDDPNSIVREAAVESLRKIKSWKDKRP